jgi:CheY-like chemotaxis protein
LSHEAVILIVGFGGPGRNGIVRRLRENHDVHVVEVPDGAAALQSIVNEPPDLVLTELELPDMNASRLLRRVRCHFPFLPHMVVAPDGNRDTASAATNSGARWCLSASHPEGILDAVGCFVRTAACGRQWEQLKGSCVRSEIEFVIDNDDRRVYAFLHALNNGKRKIHSIEDPIEYAVPGLHQSQVDEVHGPTSAELLQAILRQSPDVIMVGEVRSQTTAEIVVRAANSGNLVFATVHAAVAVKAIQSMLSLGVAPHFLASSLIAVIGQRLMRRLSPEHRVNAVVAVGEHEPLRRVAGQTLPELPA